MFHLWVPHWRSVSVYLEVFIIPSKASWFSPLHFPLYQNLYIRQYVWVCLGSFIYSVSTRVICLRKSIHFLPEEYIYFQITHIIGYRTLIKKLNDLKSLMTFEDTNVPFITISTYLLVLIHFHTSSLTNFISSLFWFKAATILSNATWPH